MLDETEARDIIRDIRNVNSDKRTKKASLRYLYMLKSVEKHGWIEIKSANENGVVFFVTDAGMKA